MKITAKVTEEKEFEAKFIQVNADVRYWGDAQINGESTENGENVPFKNGDTWEPLIDIDKGIIVDWPEGTEASFYFKVCDAGSYHLLDENKEVIASIENNYVPNGLCHGEEGFGDYIILSVNKDGSIAGYENQIDIDDWFGEEE